MVFALWDKAFWVFGLFFLLENPNFGHFGSFLGDFGQNPCDHTANLGFFCVKMAVFYDKWPFFVFLDLK